MKAGPPCRSCPICQGLAALREADPEAVHRVELASAALVGAVRELLAGTSAAWSRVQPDPQPWDPPPAPEAAAWQPIEISD